MYVIQVLFDILSTSIIIILRRNKLCVVVSLITSLSSDDEFLLRTWNWGEVLCFLVPSCTFFVAYTRWTKLIAVSMYGITYHCATITGTVSAIPFESSGTASEPSIVMWQEESHIGGGWFLRCWAVGVGCMEFIFFFSFISIANISYAIKTITY